MKNNNFTPYEKLSKAEQKKINQKKRSMWGMNPTTKVVPDKRKVLIERSKNREAKRMLRNFSEEY